MENAQASAAVTHKKRQNNQAKTLGVVGAAIAAFSLLETLDSLIFFSMVAQYLADKWHVLMAGVWSYLLGLFGIPDISRIDAVFLTFFSMMIVSFCTSLTRTDPALSGRALFKSGALTLVGLLIIPAIFTAGDITTYDAEVARTGSHAFYDSSIQSWFYSLYVSLVRPETWVEAGQSAEYIRIALLYGFYLVLTLLIVVFLFLLTLILPVHVNLWRLVARVWLIIFLVCVFIGLNYAAVFTEGLLRG